MKYAISILAVVCAASCATLTEDAMTPVALVFSDGAAGSCNLTNKRGVWVAELPATVSIRKSDDGLKYDCETVDGRQAVGVIPSEMGGKIIASAVFIDFGITDAITDKHRKYPASFVIPLARVTAAGPSPDTTGEQARSVQETDNNEGTNQALEMLDDMHNRGLITDEDYEAEKAKLLGNE